MPKYRVYYEMSRGKHLPSDVAKRIYHKGTNTGLTGFKEIVAEDEEYAADAFLLEANKTHMWDDLEPVYMPVHTFGHPIITKIEPV